MPPLHPYADDSTFDRIFEAPPRHPIAAVSLTDERNEIRDRLIAEKVLIPAANRNTTNARPPIAMPIDSEAFHRSACQIVATHPIKFAREVADSAESDPRLVAALRVILSLPPDVRDRVVQRSSRRKAAAQ